MNKSRYIFNYRNRNWPQYNQALITRGRLTFWLDEDAIEAWRATEHEYRRGAPRIYSDTAIECALVLKSIFSLSLRSAQGFTSSLIELMRLDLPVPDYTTLSRRQRSLGVQLSLRSAAHPRHVVVDATGLKVYGVGEWHMRKHRAGKRRTWRKLHLGVDEATKEIVAVEVTMSNVHDSRMLPKLLSQVPGQLRQVSGDTAYDTRACYQAINEYGAMAGIIPRRRAWLWKPKDCPGATLRNRNIQGIRELGRYEWRVSSGGTRQSVAENSVFRFKRLFGPRLAARCFDSQRTETLVKCMVLNRMTSIDMPKSVRIQ